MFSSVPALVIAAVPQRLQAVSAGMSGTTQTLGGAIGPAICFAILTANVGTLVQGQPIFTDHGLTVAYMATAIASGLTLLVAFAVPRLRVPGNAACGAVSRDGLRRRLNVVSRGVGRNCASTPPATNPADSWNRLRSAVSVAEPA